MSLIRNINNFSYFSTVEVLVTLTGDVGRVMSKMHLVQPKGQVNLVTGIRIAHVRCNKILLFTLKTLYFFSLY